MPSTKRSHASKVSKSQGFPVILHMIIRLVYSVGEFDKIRHSFLIQRIYSLSFLLIISQAITLLNGKNIKRYCFLDLQKLFPEKYFLSIPCKTQKRLILFNHPEEDKPFFIFLFTLCRSPFPGKYAAIPAPLGILWRSACPAPSPFAAGLGVSAPFGQSIARAAIS